MSPDFSNGHTRLWYNYCGTYSLLWDCNWQSPGCQGRLAELPQTRVGPVLVTAVSCSHDVIGRSLSENGKQILSRVHLHHYSADFSTVFTLLESEDRV